MLRFQFLLFLTLVLNFSVPEAFSQSIPVGTAGVEDYFRRSQLLGQLDSTVSFTIRPLLPFSIDSDLSLRSYDLFMTGKYRIGSSKNRNGIHMLPVSMKQRYTSHPSYSFNDGAMIPSKGFQTLVSAGAYAKMSPLSVQLQPEYVFAANSSFKEFSSHLGSADLPVRFGTDPYSKLLWGQSAIRLSFDPVSIGLSNENLWWGPGIKNSLLMSNTAPGFKHLTLNTTRPIKTPIGSIETQIIAARLEGSGFTNPLPDDWRYLSGIVFSYQPRWVPGLFIGLTRGFQGRGLL
jgi:hypothetical protein